MNTKTKLTNTIIWGFLLWFTGYLAGIVLFFNVPKAYIGLVITPFATLFTFWVLVKKIKRPRFVDYAVISIVWTLLATVLDYIFIVKMLNTGISYYKWDIYLYYTVTFILPILVGYLKQRKNH